MFYVSGSIQKDNVWNRRRKSVPAGGCGGLEVLGVRWGKVTVIKFGDIK